MVRGPWLANIGLYLFIYLFIFAIPVYRDFSFILLLMCMQYVTDYVVFVLTVSLYHFLVKMLAREFFF
jgi:hypothetical protein